MAIWRRRPAAVGVALFFSLPALVNSEQSAGQRAAPAGGDRLVRSELSLVGYTVSIAYAPTLNASDGSAPARVRVAQLDTNASVRLGDLAVGRRDPAGVRYDLWLDGTTDGWQLQVIDSAAAVVGHVPLTRRRAPAAPRFVAALVPQTANTARLTMHWGDYEAATDLTFAERPLARNAESNRPNVVSNYSNTQSEESIRLAQARMLAQRNETALTAGNGGRVSVMFQRTFERGNSAGADGARRGGLPADGPDFARLTSTPAGSVVMFTGAPMPRLKTEAPLRFGEVILETGNQVTGFPGSYSMWLKRTQSGWRLVFNHEPDVWGSQHNQKFDVGDVELNYSTGHAPPSRPFAVALVPTAADRGRLQIIWGPHEWSADFVVGA